MPINFDLRREMVVKTTIKRSSESYAVCDNDRNLLVDWPLKSTLPDESSSRAMSDSVELNNRTLNSCIRRNRPRNTITKPKKVLSFSETSTLIQYEIDSPQYNTSYSSEDYCEFRRNAIHLSYVIRTIFQSVNEGINDVDSNNSNGAVSNQAQAQRSFPPVITLQVNQEQALRLFNISPEEIIGIHHLIVSEEVGRVLIEMRRNHNKVVLQEQRLLRSTPSDDSVESLAIASASSSRLAAKIASIRAKVALASAGE